MFLFSLASKFEFFAGLSLAKFCALEQLEARGLSGQ